MTIAGAARRDSSASDYRLWVLVALLLAVFVLDVRLPEVVLLPFMVVPVVAAATFASARATAAMAVLALGLGITSGLVNGDFRDEDYWFRLAGVAFVAALAVYLAHVATVRERRLVAGEERLQLMLDNTADPVFLMSPEGTIEWASPATVNQIGYGIRELVGRDHLDLVHFEDRRIVIENIRLVLAGRAVQYEERIRLKAGEYRWMSVALRPFVDRRGTQTGYVAALRDIHQDVLLRDALARSERMFRLAMDGAAQGMAVVGLHHRFLEVNDALCALVHRDALWLSDHDEDELLHPDEVEPTRLMRDRLLAGKADQETRISRLLTEDGTSIRVAHGLGLLRDEHGLPLFFVCQYNDMSADLVLAVGRPAIRL
jgi:PAS domain S-box-containing protein